MDNKYFLINLAFNGYSSYGVVEVSIGKTLIGILKEQLSGEIVHFFPSSRLDRGVSAKDLWLLLIAEKTILDCRMLEKKLSNAPLIKIKKIIATDSKARVLDLVDSKIYHYYFSFNDPNHAASKFVTHFNENLNIDLMMEAAKIFQGIHHFKAFSIRTSANAEFEREIFSSEILKGDFNLSPIEEDDGILFNVYCFKVHGRGFLRAQMRMMMGALVKIGKGDLSIEQLKKALNGESSEKIGFKVPSQSLFLEKSILKSSTSDNS